MGQNLVDSCPWVFPSQFVVRYLMGNSEGWHPGGVWSSELVDDGRYNPHRNRWDLYMDELRRQLQSDCL